MTPHRSVSIARGLGSFCLLAAVLIVPPVVLASVIGWPLPVTIPDLDALVQALRSGVSDELIVNALAFVAWLAWLQIAVAIVAEIIAVLRGRPSVHLPVLPGVQAGAARLVAGIVMMTASFTPSVAMAATPPPVIAAAPAASFADLPLSAGEMDRGSAVILEAPPAELASAKPTVTVERHDSYWAIAERTLGSGYRWREIRDLNVGHTMTTGHVVTADGDSVQPGWVLELPDDAATSVDPAVEPMLIDPGPISPAPPGASPSAVEDELIVDEGDNFWTLAEEQLASSTGETPPAAETAPYWLDLIDANADRLVEPHNPDLILPGQRLCVPPIPEVNLGGPASPAVDPGPAPAGEPAVLPEIELVEPAVSEDSAGAPQVHDENDGPARATSPAGDRESEDVDHFAASPAARIATGMASVALAAGVTLAVRRRRLRAAHRAPTCQPPPTRDEHRQLQAVLVADADLVAIDDLRRCLAGLAQSVADQGGDARPMVVQHGPDYIGVFLQSASSEAPPGWRADADGAVWSLEAGAPDANPGDEDVCAAPLLITLGQPDEGGQLYLDLEAEGVVALTGDEESARGVARAILTELAVTPLAETLQILVVGNDLVHAEAASLDHVSLADSWDEVCDDLRAWAEQSHSVLAAKGWPNAFVARGHDPDHDALAPVVVVASEPPPPDLVATLRPNHPATLAVVAVGEIIGATTIVCTPDSLSIPEIGLVCSPYPLDAAVLDTIIDFLEDAEVEGTEPLGWADRSAIADAVDPESDRTLSPPFALVGGEAAASIGLIGRVMALASTGWEATPEMSLVPEPRCTDGSVLSGSPPQVDATGVGFVEVESGLATESVDGETELGATGVPEADDDGRTRSADSSSWLPDGVSWRDWWQTWLESVDAESESLTESDGLHPEGEPVEMPAETDADDLGDAEPRAEIRGGSTCPEIGASHQLALISSSDARGAADAGVASELDCTVLVRVLGDVRIEGAEALTGKQTAVVAYIALHGTVSADRLESAVWGSASGGSQRKRLNNTVSECRALIGRPLLPAAADGRYRAGPGLVTDLELFELRVGQATVQCATEAVDTLRSALALVTGPLFTYRNADSASFTWVDTENWVSTWELKVASVAERCACLLLNLERPDEAADVAVEALGIIPTHTALTEALIHAYAASGDRLAVQRVYEAHLAALRHLDIDHAEESTVDLYCRLTQRKTG